MKGWRIGIGEGRYSRAREELEREEPQEEERHDIVYVV